MGMKHARDVDVTTLFFSFIHFLMVQHLHQQSFDNITK